MDVMDDQRVVTEALRSVRAAGPPRRYSDAVGRYLGAIAYAAAASSPMSPARAPTSGVDEDRRVQSEM